jgi:hypothetical protein
MTLPGGIAPSGEFFMNFSFAPGTFRSQCDKVSQGATLPLEGADAIDGSGRTCGVAVGLIGYLLHDILIPAK